MKKLDFKSLLCKAWSNIKGPLVATFFGLLVGAIVILICGENPIIVYASMFQKAFIKPYYLAETLTRSTPVIICALATAMSWRAGYINIGVEGQMVTGTIVAAIVALKMPGPAILVMIVAWLAGMAAGALYALNYATLVPAKFDFNTSILILVYVVLGGLGNMNGTIISTVVLLLLPELLRSLRDYRMLIYAIVLIVIMIVTNNSRMKTIIESFKKKISGKGVKAHD